MLIAIATAGALAPSIALATDPDPFFTIDGSVQRTWLGGAVHSAGDVNGDGREDMIVGRHSEEGGTPAPEGVTAAIVVFGATDLGHLTVGGMTSEDGFRIWPSGESDGSGNYVDGVGDVNGDGFDDVIVASPWAFNDDRPVAHVILGRANPSDVDLADFSSEDGWSIAGGPAIWNGVSVAGAGDVDLDGFDDIALGFQSSAEGTPLSGSVFVVRGSDDPADVDLLTATDGVIRIDGSGATAGLGFDLGSGDVDDDGYSDVVIRAGQPGAIVVAWGGPAMSDIDLADPEPGAASVVTAPYLIDANAKETLAVGDINGDGKADVAYGDPWFQKGGNAASMHGAVNVLLGGTTFPSATWQIVAADIHDSMGWWVDVRDVDGNGRADILTSAESAPGTAYLIRGRTATSNVDLSVADASAWRPITAPFDADFRVIGLGLVDVTGDARPDILLSEPQGDPDEIGYPGRVFVIPTVDLTPPTVTAPTWFVRSGLSLVDGKPSVRVMWSSSDVGLGVEHYEIAESIDGGPFATFATATTFLHVDRTVALGHTHRFRVRAIDHGGNVGTWATGPTSRFSAVSQSAPSVRYRGSWSTATSSTSFWGGTSRASSAAGATASYTFTGRSITWVGLTSRTRGKAAIYINGSLKATVDLWSSTLRTKHLIWQTTYTTSATRTITIKVLGTAGRPRVDVDGFIVGN